MKVLVCGGRKYGAKTEEKCRVHDVLSKLHRDHGVTVLIEGGATGADRLGRAWALANRVVVVTHEAQWERDGLQAGPIRNRKMLEEERPDLVVAFPGGSGTANMKMLARANGFEVMDVDCAYPQFL